MRFVGFSQTNNNVVLRKSIAIGALLLFTACSPLANRLDVPASNGEVYPLSDGIVTNSISSRSEANYAQSRHVSSQPIAPIKTYETTSCYEAPVREPVQVTQHKTNDGVVAVRAGDTLLGVAREHGVDAVDLAELNSLEAPYSLRVGDELALPGTIAAKRIASNRTKTQKFAEAKAQPKYVLRKPEAPITKSPKIKKTKTVALPVAKPKKKRIAKVVIPNKKVAIKKLEKKTEKKAVRVASVKKPSTNKKTVSKTSTAKLPLKRREAKTKTATLVGNKFRWPVKGRVISEFGSKSNGAKNDGINLSVPKGAAIVAAENGLVVYSGNELKGYGNLVLIRHTDGWSTAYAHISQMLVKKGQKVRRGQVIAKAGQTGSVCPQLHFEIRRGTNPVNPRKHLSGTKVAIR